MGIPSYKHIYYINSC